MNAWDISFSSLSVGYGDHAVLHDINATLPGGKVSVILGGSGCGKSTLLRHIIGLSRPISGNLRIGGQDLFSLPHAEARRIRRRMGVLFQDGALLGALTLVQNVCLPLSEHLRLPKDVLREAGLRVLRMVGLEAFADYFPNQLSGGMRKRAGLARALIAEPRILLCDEPTSGLDPIIRDDILDILYDFIQDEEHSVFLSSHITGDLEKIADYVAFIHQGKVLMVGEKDTLLETYGLYHCTKDLLLELEPQAVAGYRESGFGVTALVLRERMPAHCEVENASLDDIMLYSIKGKRL